MNIPEKIFKAYDIRGVYPEEINEENLVPIIRAIYKFLTQDHDVSTPFKFVVARDMRTHSPSLHQVAVDTLIKLGAEVIDLGIVSTPTFYFAVHHYGYDGGMVITASHNPRQYNGIKIVKNTEAGILKIGQDTGMMDIKKLSLEGVELAEPNNGTIIEQLGVVVEEVKNAVRIAGDPHIEKFKVVADTANAMGSTYIDALFEQVPGDLVRMNFELDGTFPIHQADPMQSETLRDIQKRIIEESADFGLAPDGDGDRLFFLDENAAIVSPSIITSIVARELLSKNHGEKIIVDVKYNLTSRQNIESFGGELVVSKTGHAFITQKLQQTGGIFAGEASAHYFFREAGGGEAPMPVILFVLAVMTREGKKLSEIAKEFKKSHESGEINFAVENAAELMDIIKKEYEDGDVLTLDGVAISYPNKRISLRNSNTEPLLRLNVESLELEVMEETKKNVMDLIQKHGKHIDASNH